MNFDFATANRIIFGPGSLEQVGGLAAAMGSHALVVVGQDRSRSDALMDLLRKAKVKALRHSVTGEPTVEQAALVAEAGQGAGCDMVIAMGGGGALDAGKAVAALLTNGRPVFDYLEVIGRGVPLEFEPVPCIAIPTTAGTGSEVTRNAVLASKAHRVKVSMRSPLMLPRLALVDPLLSLDLPPALTAATGMDALTQCLEAFVGTRSNPLVDALAKEGIACCAGWLRKAYHDGRDQTARERMALGSLLGGLALANAGLGAVHGIAGPLGGMVPAPHGATCGRLLPLVMTANIEALQSESDGSPFLQRYRELAVLLCGQPSAEPMDGAAWVAELCEALKLPGLRRYGLTRELIPELVAKAQKASSMQSNPVMLDEKTLNAVCERAL